MTAFFPATTRWPKPPYTTSLDATPAHASETKNMDVEALGADPAV